MKRVNPPLVGWKGQVVFGGTKLSLSTFSTLVMSTIQADATRDLGQSEDAHHLPRGFFDDTHDGVYVGRLRLNPPILVSDFLCSRTSLPQLIPILVPLRAIAETLSRPWDHVHVQLSFAPLHSFTALKPIPKMQCNSRSGRDKVSFQSFPPAATDPRLWKSHMLRIEKYNFSPLNEYLVLIHLLVSICRPTKY